MAFNGKMKVLIVLLEHGTELHVKDNDG